MSNFCMKWGLLEEKIVDNNEIVHKTKRIMYSESEKKYVSYYYDDGSVEYRFRYCMSESIKIKM